MKRIKENLNKLSSKLLEELNDNIDTKIRIYIKESQRQARKETSKLIKSKPLSIEEKILKYAEQN